MAQQHEITSDSSKASFIALSKAVARAHSRLFPEEPYKDPKTLSVIALALSGLIPIYWRDPQSSRLFRLTDEELAAERFTQPAMELLVVSESRLQAALERLQVASLDEARASLTLRQSPRPPKPR